MFSLGSYTSALMLRLCSVQFSCSVMSDSLGPHESQQARPPCPSSTPAVYSNSCPSSRWCHPAISSSVVPFSSCPQFLPASGSFPMSQLFAWGGQSIGVSALTSVVFHSKNTGSHQIWVSVPTIFVKKYWALLFSPLLLSSSWDNIVYLCLLNLI